MKNSTLYLTLVCLSVFVVLGGANPLLPPPPPLPLPTPICGPRRWPHWDSWGPAESAPGVPSNVLNVGSGFINIPAETVLEGQAANAAGLAIRSQTIEANTASAATAATGTVVRNLRPILVRPNKQKIIEHYGSAIKINSPLTRFIVSSSPVLVKPTLVSKPSKVSVKSQVQEEAGGSISISPVVAKLAKRVEQPICQQSVIVNEPSISVRGGIRNRPCGNPSCPACAWN